MTKTLSVDKIIEIIENEQERYCNLGNGGSIDYNDFIDCLENLKEIVVEYCENLHNK